MQISPINCRTAFGIGKSQDGSKAGWLRNSRVTGIGELKQIGDTADFKDTKVEPIKKQYVTVLTKTPKGKVESHIAPAGFSKNFYNGELVLAVDPSDEEYEKITQGED